MASYYLEKRLPEKNQHRFYRIRTALGVFGDWVAAGLSVVLSARGVCLARLSCWEDSAGP